MGKAQGIHRSSVLSAAYVRTVKQPGFYPDGHGLYLKVEKSGARRWVQRLMIHGKRRDIGLGSASLVTLAVARELALENRKLARAGGDPIALKRKPSILAFREAARRVHDLNIPNWKNPKHGKQWISTLTEYAFPHFGDKRIDLIESADIHAALAPIWTSKPETARRVKQRIKAVIDWSIGQGWRKDNPADTITKSLPPQGRIKKHQRALPFTGVADAIKRVWQSEASLPTKLAFEFLVLTATRSGEVRKAEWSEISLDKGIWTIPAERMKAGKEHRVPLPDRCLEILKQAEPLKHPDSDTIFPGTRAGKPLSDVTLSKLLKELGIDAVPHGFRTSFRMWAAEKSGFPHQVCEFALSHVIDNKAEAAYNRSDLFDQRRALMGDWQTFLRS